MRAPVTLPTTARNQTCSACRARSIPECLSRADREPGQLQCVSQVDLVTPRDDGTRRPPLSDTVTYCSCCASAASTASASGTFCVRRRCLAGGAPEAARCAPEVDRVICCGCSTRGPDWSVYGLTMKRCGTRLSTPLTKLEASSGLVFYRPGFPNGTFRRGHYSTGNSEEPEEPFLGLTCRRWAQWIAAGHHPGSQKGLNPKQPQAASQTVQIFG
jgi:hypothetical protein